MDKAQDDAVREFCADLERIAEVLAARIRVEDFPRVAPEKRGLHPRLHPVGAPRWGEEAGHRFGSFPRSGALRRRRHPLGCEVSGGHFRPRSFSPRRVALLFIRLCRAAALRRRWRAMQGCRTGGLS